MQNSNSTMCSSFCICIAHLIFSTNFDGDASGFVYNNDDLFKRSLTHVRSH